MDVPNGEPTTQPELLVVASNDAGTRAHLYRTVKSLLSGDPVGADAGPRMLEFFDAEGYRLGPTFDATWQLVSFGRTAEAPDPELVRGRLLAAVESVGEYLELNREELLRRGVNPDMVMSLLPDLTGLDLAASFNASRRMFGHDVHTHDGSAWHNWIVHGIFS